MKLMSWVRVDDGLNLKYFEWQVPFFSLMLLSHCHNLCMVEYRWERLWDMWQWHEFYLHWFVWPLSPGSSACGIQIQMKDTQCLHQNGSLTFLVLSHHNQNDVEGDYLVNEYFLCHRRLKKIFKKLQVRLLNSKLIWQLINAC